MELTPLLTESNLEPVIDYTKYRSYTAGEDIKCGAFVMIKDNKVYNLRKGDLSE